MAPRRPPRAGRLLRWSALALVALAAAPGTAAATVDPLSATLESGGFEEFSQTGAEQGTLAVATDRAFEGAISARANYAGGGDNGYARGIWNVHWSDGDDVWFGAAYYLPVGFHARIQGQVDLLRWDNWEARPNDTDWGGVSIYGSDRRARLLRFGAGRPNDELVGPIDLPEGRWFTLEVHQVLSDGGSGLSELYVDGRLVGRSTAPNTYGRGIDRIRYGIVAIASGSQREPLELWFDRATAGPEPGGSIAAPSPASARRPARAASARRCTVRRLDGRRGGVRFRRVVRRCVGARRSCRTALLRARAARFRRVRKIRTCLVAGQRCQARRQFVHRRGHRPQRTHARRCVRLR